MFKAVLIILLGVVIILFMFWFFSVCPTFKKAAQATPIRIQITGITDSTIAVIHHTAGNKIADRDLTVEEIDRYHKSKGWDGIGYHFVIRKNGNIETGRDINLRGAHAKGRNDYIGIALTGYDKFTKEQAYSLMVLLNILGTEHIENHHEHCPGPGLNLQDIADTLKITFKEIK